MVIPYVRKYDKHYGTNALGNTACYDVIYGMEIDATTLYRPFYMEEVNSKNVRISLQIYKLTTSHYTSHFLNYSLIFF